jgi:hypothetical protein
METSTDRLRAIAVGAMLLVAIYIPFYLLTLTNGQGAPRDGTSLVVGRDFLNIWMVGRAAWAPDPARYYDIDTYLAALSAVVGPGYPGQLWSYPPTAMFIGAPLGLLPYAVALALWTVSGMTAFGAALRLWTRDWRIIALMLVSPAAMFGVISGQFACFAAAIVLTALRWRTSRPLLAGLLLGLLTVKPQLGLLFPVMLLATRNWRMISGAAITTLGLGVAAALLWGVDIWRVYLSSGIANQSLVLSDPDHLAGPFMPTLFMNLRVAGISVNIAGTLQMLLSLLVVAAVWVTFRCRPAADDLRANALFLACAVCCTPYMLSYDTLALASIALLMLARGQSRLLPMLVYYLPLIQIAAGTIGFPGPFLIPAAFAALLLCGAEGFPRHLKKYALVN